MKLEYFKKLRVRILFLAVLLGATYHLAGIERGLLSTSVQACEQCVAVTGGGYCVGCLLDQNTGYTRCTPDQSSCKCIIGAECWFVE